MTTALRCCTYVEKPPLPSVSIICHLPRKRLPDALSITEGLAATAVSTFATSAIFTGSEEIAAAGAITSTVAIRNSML